MGVTYIMDPIYRTCPRNREQMLHQKSNVCSVSSLKKARNEGLRKRPPKCLDPPSMALYGPLRTGCSEFYNLIAGGMFM